MPRNPWLVVLCLFLAVAGGFAVGWLWPSPDPAPRKFKFEPSYYPDPERVKNQIEREQAETM